jgi:glycosyltransferase involved in cell wall biosynthesis
LLKIPARNFACFVMTPRRAELLQKALGAQAAQADFIAFLDDDDLYAPEYLERTLAVFDRYPQVEVVCMGVSFFGVNAVQGEAAYQQAMERTLCEAKRLEAEPGVILFGDTLLEALLNRVPMAFQRPVVHRKALIDIRKT